MPDIGTKLLQLGERLHWPEIPLNHENILPSGQRRWELFARYVSTPNRNAVLDTRRRMFGQLALLLASELIPPENQHPLPF
ncbi:MAG: hypothetical protein RMI90_10525 [Thermoguttaceae bacterium]|nr:hypothetical protein [Thermoguttaceae bacterium]